MLCTFTTEQGALIIRSDDIRSIEDVSPGENFVGDWALLRWMIGDQVFKIGIKGTAIENRDRIQHEELELIARVEAHRYETQKQLQAGYPVPPIKRGKQ